MGTKRFAVTLVKSAFLAVVLLAGVATEALAQGSISGRVIGSDAPGGLPGTVIQFYDLNADDFYSTTTTDGTGNYFASLPAGSYAVLTQNTLGYINEIYNDVQCSAVCNTNDLDAVVVTNAAVTNINFTLDPGSRISGNVTATGGSPLANVRVYFVDPGGQLYFTSGLTDALGNYTSDGGSASGNVFAVTENTLGYFNEAYDNIPCSNCDANLVGTPIAITLGTPKTGINFALDPGGRISGNVTDQTPTPLANVDIHVFNSSGNHIDRVTTDGSGNYASNALSNGNYYVTTENFVGLVDKLYNNVTCPGGFCNVTTGTAIAVTVPATNSGKNFVLTPGGTFTGTVTNSAGGAPINNAQVNIFNSAGNFLAGAFTNASGVYVTAVLPAGTYYAQTTNVPGFVNQLYNNIQCPSFCTPTTGTAITVTVNNSTPSINFALVSGGSITGTVTQAAGGAPIQNMGVQVYSSSGSFLSSTSTDGSGFYTLTVSGGSYYVRTNAFGTVGQYINLLYNSGGNVTCISCQVNTSGGSLVVVSSGGTTGSINFALAVGARISGTMTNAAGGAPIPNNASAQIVNSAGTQIASFSTDGSGNYITSGLPAATYYVRSSNTLGFINKLYNNKPCTIQCTATTGDPVILVGTSTMSGINFALDAGGRFSGSVTNAATAAAVGNASIGVYNSGGTLLGFLGNDFSTGNYTTSGVPAGTYFARVQVNNSGYVGQAYNGRPCTDGSCIPTMTATDPISVSVGAITTGINFPLTLGGRISGAISNADTLAAITSGVTVRIFDSGGTQIASAFPDGSGNYIQMTGVPAGTYYAKTTNSISFYDRLYNNKPCGFSCTVTTGTPLSITSGATISSVNFKLLPIFTYTDATITSQVTVVKAAHLNELRTYINQLRKQVALSPFTFTDTLTAGVTEVKVVHITELRTALDAVYDALALTHYSYTDPVLTAGTMIKQVHVADIRSAIQAVQ